MNQEEKTINLSTWSIVKFILLILLLIFFYLIREIIAIVFFSIVIASAVRPAARWLEKYYLPRSFSVVFIYLVAFLSLSIIFYFIIPPLIFEVVNFINSGLPSLGNVISFTLPDFLPKFGVSTAVFPDILNQFSSEIQKNFPELSQGFFAALSNIFGGVFSFVTIIVLSFYFSVQEGGIEHFLRIVSPSKYENYVLGLWERSQKKISKWLRGQLLLGVLVGVIVFFGLTILRVEYAFSLAVIAALLELIPYIGPILSAIPAVFIGLTQGLWIGVAVLALYIIIQQIENHLLVPLVMKKVIGIPTIIVILSLLIGVKLAGFFGILLSVPVAVIIIEVLNDIAEKKQLFNRQ